MGESSRIRIAVVGSASATAALQAELMMRRASRYTLVGRIAPTGHANSSGSLGSVSSLCATIERERIDLVLIAGNASRVAVVQALDKQIDAGTARVMDLSAFCEAAFGYVPIGDASGTWVSHLLHPRYRRGCTPLQRVFDIVVAACIGLLFLPVMVVLAALIKLDGGPVFFKQVRIGEGGRPITIRKLRTMRPDTSSSTNWCQLDDERITWLGRYLRRLHVDELPQLVSVLRGEMRMVGPRPEQRHYVERLEALLPFYTRRHLIRPGLTGWAQIRCGYGGSDEGSAWKLCHDLYYVKHQSLRLDISILFATAALLLNREKLPLLARDGLTMPRSLRPAIEMAGSQMAGSLSHAASPLGGRQGIAHAGDIQFALRTSGRRDAAMSRGPVV